MVAAIVGIGAVVAYAAPRVAGPTTTPVIVEWEKVKDDDAKTHVDSNEGRFKFLIWDENGVPYSGSLSNAQRQTKDGDYAAPFDATVTNGVWETNGNQPSGKAWKLFIPDGYTYEARFTGSAVINNIDGYGVPADGGTDQVNWSAGNKVSGTDNDNPSTIRFETVVPTEDPNTGSSVPPVILEFLGVDNNGNFTTDAPTGAFQLRIKGPNGENLPSLYLPSAGGSYPDALNYLDRATIDANWTGQGEYTYANIWGWASNKRIDSVNSGHAYALNIPEGYSYSIEYVGQGELVSVKGQEITPDSTDDDRIVTGTVSGTGDWTSNRVVFKARWQDASAKIMKFVSGEASSDADFTFTLTADTNFNSGAWKKYDGAGNVIEESTDENKFSGKEATFTLKGDQYIIIDGIPYGTKYTVTEAPAEGYVQTDSVNADTEMFDPGKVRITKFFNAPTTEVPQAADPKDDDLSFEHHKRLDSLSDGVENEDTDLQGEDFSRLYLDMTGYQKAMDILFIVDRSNSMRNFMANGDPSPNRNTWVEGSRESAVVDYLYGDPGSDSDGFLAEFLNKNTKNNVAVTYFGGKTNYMGTNDLPEIYGGDPSLPFNVADYYKFGSSVRDHNTFVRSGTSQDIRYDYSHGLWNNGQGLDKGQNAGVIANWTSGADFQAGGTVLNEDGIAPKANTEGMSDEDAAAANEAAGNSNRAQYSGTMVATDYVSGLFQALHLLDNEEIQSNGNDKLVVFLTDGAPTVWVSPDRVGTGRGDLDPTDFGGNYPQRWMTQLDVAEYGKVTPATYADYKAWREAYEADNLQDATRLFYYGRGSEIRGNAVSNLNLGGIARPMDENKENAYQTNRDAELRGVYGTADYQANLPVSSIQQILMPTIMDFRENLYAWDEQYGRTNQTQLYAVGFGTSEADTGFLNNLSPSNKDDDGNGVAFSAQNGQELIDALNKILYQFPQDVTITDNLSKYVKFYEDQPDVKVVMEKLDNDGNPTGEKVTLYEKGALTEAGREGSYLTAANPDGAEHNPILDVNNPWTFTPTAAQNAELPYSSTGTFALNFDDAYTMSNEWRYTVSFNVETSKTAYKEHDENGSRYLARDIYGKYVKLATDENGNLLDADGNIVTKQEDAQVLATGVSADEATVILGQADTDYLPTGNKTSSGQPGFYTNDSADVSYKLRADGPTKSEPYDLPVVQVTEKKVDGSFHDDLGAQEEHFTYTISEQIGKGAVNVKLEDELNELLQLVDPDTNIKVTDEEGNDLQFEKTIAETDSEKYGKVQKLTITVPDSEFAEKTRVVTFSFVAQVKPDLPNSVLSDHYKTVTDHNGTHSGIPNKATLTVNDAPHVTNEVTVTPPPFEPEKRINGDVHADLVNRDEVFHYTVDMLIPDDTRTAGFKDVLDNVLKFDGTGYTVTVHDGSNDGAGTVIKTGALPDDKTLEFTFTDEDLEKSRGKIVTVAFDAAFDIDNITNDDIAASAVTVTDNRTVKTDITEHTGTPNKAAFIINGGSHDTNTVTVVPPIPVKQVNGKQHEDLTNRDEVFEYTITQAFHEQAVEVAMEDTLESVLEFVKTEFEGAEVDAYAVDETGAAVELEPVAIEGQKITVKVKDNGEGADARSAAAGKTVTFHFNAKIKDSATEADLEEYKVEEIVNVPNEAKVFIKGVPHVTNKVTVTPPNPGTLVIKKVQAGDDEKQEFTFEVAFTKEAPVDGPEYVDPTTIQDLKVTEMGTEVAAGSLQTKEKTEGETTYKVLVVKAKDGAETKIEGIPANFSYTVTERPAVGFKKTNETNSTGTIVAEQTATAEFQNEPAPRETPEKFVNGIKTPAVKLGAREEIFTYTVKQKVPSATTKMVITDKLEEVLELVDANGDPVAEGTQYPIDGTTLGIKIEGEMLDGSVVDIAAMDRPDGTTDPDTGDVLKTGIITVTEESGRQLITVTMEDEGGGDAFYEVTLTFRAKIKDGITDEELIARNVGTSAEGTNEVPNTAGVAINNDAAVDTNTVWVYPPEPASLRIVKIEKGQEGNTEPTEFTFEVELTDTEGNHVDPDKLDGLHVNGKKLDADGQTAKVEGEEGAKVLVVKAKDGTDASITGIPAGYGYKVVERISDTPGFRQTHGLNTEGTIAAGAVAHVTYANEPVPADKPEKKVNGVDEYTLSTRPETFTYTVSQKVPENAATLDFADQLEWVLAYQGPLTMSIEGVEEPVTLEANVADVVVDSKTQGKKPAQKITATYAPEGGLADLEGKTVTFTFKANIIDGVHDDVLVAEYGQERKVPNEATVAVDGRPQVTNTVFVNPPKEPEKFINDIKNDKETPVELAERPEEFTYTVTQMIPSFTESAENATVTFTDKLEDVLEVVGEPSLDLVDGWTAGVSEEDGRQVVTATIADAKALSGSVVTLTFKAKIKDTVTDKALLERFKNEAGNISIPNKATVKVGDSPEMTTNEVFVTPPPSPREDPEKTIQADHEAAAHKGLSVLELRSEEFTYSVNQKLPADAISAKFEDTVDDLLEIIPDSASITVAGETVEGLNATIEGQLVSAELNQEQAIAARGKVVTLNFKAKIKAGVTDEQIVEANKARENAADYGEDVVVPNKATVTVNDDPKVTNEVLVTPPNPNEVPEKFVNGIKNDKDTPVKLETRPESFIYKVTQVIPDNAATATFTDVLEDVLEYVNDGTAAIVVDPDTDSQQVLEVEVAYNQETNTVSAANIDVKGLDGKTVAMIFTAKIKDGVTDEQLLEKYAQTTTVPNTAIVSIDGRPNSTNTVYVEPPAEHEDPEKFVEGKKYGVDDAADVDEQGEKLGAFKLSARDQEFTYTVDQVIPANSKKAVFTDEIEEILDITSVKLLDATGTEIEADNVEITVTNKRNIVTAEIEGDALKAQWTKKVTLEIKAKIKDGVTDEQLLTAYGSLDVPNEATVTIDNNPQATNEVKVTPPPSEDEPEKFVNGKKHGTDDFATDPTLALGARDEVFTYTVKQKIPVGAVNVVFSDTLERVLEVVGDPTIDAPGVKPVVNGNIVTATIEDATKLVGETITLTIKAKIKDDVTDAELLTLYGSLDVPNEATVTINNKQQVTNEVIVTPPPNEEEPVKKINDQYGLVELAARDELFTYTVEQVIPANATEAVFTDTLEDVLEIVGKPSVDANGADVKVDGNTITATLTGDALKAVWTQKVTLTINAKSKANVTDADLIARYGTTIVPNEAEVTIDGNGKPTNVVEVTPPPTEEEPVKKINDQYGLVELAARDEVFTYTVEQYIPANATTAEFVDTLEDVLEIVGTPTVDAEGADINVDGQKVTATLEGDALKAAWTNTVTLTIQAKIKADVTDADLIAQYGTTNVPNKAEVTIDGNGKPTNVVEVTPPPNEEEPVKKINDQFELVELTARDEVFTYTVEQKIPAGAVNVVFYDKLENVLQVVDQPTIDVPEVTPVVSGQTVTATIDDATSLAGKVVTLTIQAKIKDGITDAQLITLYGSTNVPNTATVTIDGTPKVTNEVLVTPPSEPTPDPVGSVRVEHITEDGTVLRDWADVQRDQPAGTEYTTSQETFPGYEFVAMDPTSAAAAGVVVADTTLDVIYVYQPIDTVPEKLINNQKELVSLETRPEVFTYTVSQVIPGGAVNVVFSDTLEAVLEVVGTPTVDAQGAQIAVDGQTVTATFADATALTGQRVTLTINAKLRDGVTDAQLLALYGNTTNVPNKATVTINDRPQDTNEVLVTPPPSEEVPVKKVNNVDAITLETRTESFMYTVDQYIPVNAVTAVFTDTLEDVLEFIDETAAVAVNPGTDDANLVNAVITFDGQTITATVSGEELQAAWGKTLRLAFPARIKADVTDAQLIDKYGTLDVPNKATVSIDGKPQATNEVLVTPPNEVTPVGSVRVEHITTTGDILKSWEDVQRDQPAGTEYTTSQETFPGYEFVAMDPTSAAAAGVVVADTTLDVIYVYQPIDTVPEKLINGQKELVSLETRPEVFTYTVSQVIPGGAVNVVFSDTLEDVLEVVGMPTLNVPGAEVKVDGQVVTATIADATSLATQTVTLTINAKLRDGVTDAQLIEAYGNDEQVPNKATVTIDGTPNVTNEVLVTPPPVGSVIVKYITEDGTILEDWSDVQRDVPAGTDYTTEQKTFEGYEFVKMDDTSAEANGKTIAPGTLEVIYVYKPVVEPVGSVIVKYITEDGTILEDWSDVQRDVPAGTDYTTTQKEFDGYEFVKMDDASAEANGKTIAPGTLEVIYVYKPINEEPYEPDNPNRNYTTNKFDLTFTKTLDDKIVTEAGKFNFVLVGISENAKGMEFKAANDANGQVSFKDIEIKQPGDYLFSVSEVIPSDTKGIIYDQTVYTLHVHIYRKGTETLAEWWITKADSAVELEAADYVFKNETEPEVPEEPTEPEKPTPDTPTTPTPSTPTPTTPTPTTPTTTTTPAPTTPTQTTTTTGATTVARTATAKTGDATNLALMGGMAVAGLLVLVAARKVREN